MGRQRRREPILIENIEIIDTANKGKSVARHEGRAIFVQGGVPGDICDITVFKKQKKFWVFFQEITIIFIVDQEEEYKLLMIVFLYKALTKEKFLRSRVQKIF